MYYLDYVCYLYKTYPELTDQEINQMAGLYFFKIFMFMMVLLVIALILEGIKAKYEHKVNNSNSKILKYIFARVL